MLVTNPPWRIVFPFAMWSIWKSRKNVIFSNKRRNPNLDGDILNQALEFMHYVSTPRVPMQKVLRGVCWEKLPEGWVKLNTDGSVDRGQWVGLLWRGH